MASPFKTDQRDARTIARLLRAGELTTVYELIEKVAADVKRL